MGLGLCPPRPSRALTLCLIVWHGDQAEFYAPEFDVLKVGAVVGALEADGGGMEQHGESYLRHVHCL